MTPPTVSDALTVALAGLAGATLDPNTEIASIATRTRSASPGKPGRGQLDPEAVRGRRRALWRFYRDAQRLTPGRPAWCGRLTPRDWVEGSLKTPEVWLDTETRRARYRRLAYCESVWSCPICAERITAGRAREVQDVVSAWRRAGGDVALVTYTARHARGDDLRGLIGQFRKALRKMKSRRDYRDFRARAGYRGSIRALEVTYSDSHGWHPHVHEIWLIRPGLILDTEALAREGYELWARAAAAVELETDHRAYNLQAGARVVGDYLTRGGVWGLGAELARLPSKRGQLSPAGGYAGATPMQILARAVAGDVRAVALWIEYSHAMHGQRQLWWSQGLRERFAEPSRLLDPPPLRTETLALELDGPAWRAVIRARAETALLDAVETGGPTAGQHVVSRCLARAGPAPPT